MRLVGAPLIDAFPNRILNIHPSLLPSFPGLDAQKQAIEHGVKVSGVTVHLVTAELDGGPIVVQRAVPVIPGDTADSLAARILEEEHRAYPEAVQMILDGGWRVDGRRFVRLDFRRPLQRDDRDFRRAVDPDRHVDRSDPTADEHRRVVVASRVPTALESCVAPARRRPAARPDRRACVLTARRARPARPLRRAVVGSCASRITVSRARPTTRAISDAFRVQNLIPASSSPSPRISTRVRASLST